MTRRPSHQSSLHRSRLAGWERLEPRRVLDCHGFATFGLCVAGDSDQNGEFDQDDLVLVLQADKYMTGEPADWGQGDWNGDGSFDQQDIMTALQSDTYRQGALVVDLSPLVANVPAHPESFGPPIVVSSPEQLYGAIPDETARRAIADATDFSRQSLLLFSWSGSGGDQLVAAPHVVAGQANVDFRFQYGLTDDLRPHQVLLAAPKDAVWHIDVADAVTQEQTTSYQFVAETSRLRVSGGIAGVNDEYRIEGTFDLARNDDGTAIMTQVNAVLRGNGLSSLDGQPLESVLNLSNLSGLQTGSSSVVFSGWDHSGSAVIKLQVFTQDESLQFMGRSIPPCCDFFQYEIDAMAMSAAQ